MGEIKSTLDLVMEKTKHLTLSSAEKEAQKHDSLQKKIKGLLQKFMDGIINKEELSMEVETIRETDGSVINDILQKEIFDRLDLDKDNEPLLVLMDEFHDIDVQPFLSLFKNYEVTIQTASQQRKKEIKESLALDRFISGSAVVPNLESDSRWLKEHAKLHGEFSRTLADQLSQIKLINN